MQILPTHRTGVSSREARVVSVLVFFGEMEGEVAKPGRRDL